MHTQPSYYQLHVAIYVIHNTVYSLEEYNPQPPAAGVIGGWLGVSPTGKMLTAYIPAHIVEQRHLKIDKFTSL